MDAQTKKQHKLHQEVMQSYIRLRESNKLPREYIQRRGRVSDPGMELSNAVDRVAVLREKHHRASCPGVMDK